MSYNKSVVEYFTSEFYQFEKTELEHLVSASFSFTINGSDAMDFKEFSSRREHLFLNASIIHGEFVSTDDINFLAPVSITNLSAERVDGEINFKIENTLLERVDVNYHLTQIEYKNFFSKLFKDY